MSLYKKSSGTSSLCSPITVRETQQLRLIGDLRDTDFPDKVDEFIRRCDINVFINNAGVHLSKSPRRTTDEEVDEVIESNLTSQIKVLNRVYNYFVEKNDGMIININSLCVRHPSPTETVYCASKFGLLGFSKALQIDALGRNVEIVDVFPGIVQTRMTRNRDNYETLMSQMSVQRRLFPSLIKEGKRFIIVKWYLEREMKARFLRS